MPAKALVTGIILVIMVVMLIFCMEFFLPLSMKADMNMVCRRALLEMENAGGMSAAKIRELRTELEGRGLSGVAVTATSSARQGGMLTLRVDADYTYNRLTSLFKREDVTLHMVYQKASMSRKVVN